MDFTLAQTSVVGVTPYEVFLVEITNDQVSFDATDASRIVDETRILIADGYRSYAALDGYLNPIVRQENGENLFLSAGQLTSDMIAVGPIVFPYFWNNFSGGTDAQIFQPPANSTNIQVYIQIRGVALSPSGNFFDVKQMQISDMGGLSYKLICQANSSVVV